MGDETQGAAAHLRLEPQWVTELLSMATGNLAKVTSDKVSNMITENKDKDSFVATLPIAASF